MDEPLPTSYVEEWKELENEFQQATNIIVPRSAAPENTCYTLHIYCDASTKAYGAAAYLVSDSESLLLTSRARVAPLKTKTIPQLELTALLIGTRLVYLQWMKNDISKIPYVKSRV